jgi:hypothetical protein
MVDQKVLPAAAGRSAADSPLLLFGAESSSLTVFDVVAEAAASKNLFVFSND